MTIFHRFFWFLGNSRIEERHPSGQRVTLTWVDWHGRGHVHGTCQDISAGGMGVECSEPVPLKTTVVACIHDRRSSAIVRYRVRQESTYRLGLEFIQPPPIKIR